MKGMNDLVRQAQIMQRKLAKVKEDMADQTIEATAGGGMVTVVCTGSQEIKSITIDKAVVDPEDIDMLQDLVLAAVNDAVKKSKDMVESEMQGLTGGISIPGLF